MIQTDHLNMETGTPCLLYFEHYAEIVLGVWIDYREGSGIVNISRGIGYSNYHGLDNKNVEVDFSRNGNGFAVPNCIFKLTETEYLTKIVAELI